MLVGSVGQRCQTPARGGGLGLQPLGSASSCVFKGGRLVPRPEVGAGCAGWRDRWGSWGGCGTARLLALPGWWELPEAHMG